MSQHFHPFSCKVKDVLEPPQSYFFPAAVQLAMCEEYLLFIVTELAQLASSNMLGHVNSFLSGPYLPSVVHESALKVYLSTRCVYISSVEVVL